MPKFPRILAAASALAAAFAVSAAEAPDAQAAWERIKSLAGEWAGRMEDPLAGPPAAMRYEVASGGAAVIEYQNPGQSYEAVTVYFLADGKLRATHYSGAGNQPAFRLGRESTEELLLLELDGGTGFDAARDGHVHRGEIRLVSPDRIEQRWFHYVGPKEQGVTHWFLERQPKESPAPQSPPAPPSPPAQKTG